ncbi:hypothetical protein R69927_05764 [Paraburkholderia domus]|uniref:Uncharacterized protein n=1 Tax=Paraburkholderia domus TaxID=2793075 RepID=A0A9N8N8B2_9BURK|nr:hypothetical protein R75483_04983 [Paraburkholderia domus]CAE6844902.1 hypothetical protein R70006_07284 [Paraburkholderia domus]CAE6885636.1 hypothetical protein R69749_07304 [Paraburkholderia domus]CAE6907281.1 hypothetical protein R69927_05764 [Paraburkholderia domus]CAE6931713.1 hypothetical protein R70199_05529 [Paraburkholderia domus]
MNTPDAALSLQIDAFDASDAFGERSGDRLSEQAAMRRR